MTSRKHFIASRAALLGAPFLPACTPSAPDQNCAAAASRIWQPLDAAAVLVASANDKAHWVETGRCYQRFALQAAALGIRNAILNQASRCQRCASSWPASWAHPGSGLIWSCALARAAAATLATAPG